MAFYTRYIDIDGSYRICNPSTLNVNSDIICNEDREEEDPTCNHRRSDTALYTDYDIPAELMCGRLTIGGNTSGPHQRSWNYWGNWWWNRGYGGSYNWLCNQQPCWGWFWGSNRVERITGGGWGWSGYYNYGYEPIKCSEVPGERYNEFTRIAGCQESRCISFSWYSSYNWGYYYGSWGAVCDALNGERDKHQNCRSEPCDETCSLEADIIQRTYSVEYEVVRGAYYCLSDFDKPESSPCNGIIFGLTQKFYDEEDCTSTPSQDTMCPDENGQGIGSRNCEPAEPPAGFTEIGRTPPNKIRFYARTDNCDNSCGGCVPCQDETVCRTMSSTASSIWSLIGSNCCSWENSWIYNGYYGRAICPDYTLGPNVKFVLSGGSCLQKPYDYDTVSPEVDYGRNRQACFNAEDNIDFYCVDSAPDWQAVPECEDMELGECEIRGPNYSREYPSSGGGSTGGGGSFHECIPPTPPSPPGPTTRNYQSKTTKYAELTKFTHETTSITYVCDMPTEYYKWSQCHGSYYGDDAGDCGCPTSFNETNSCDQTVFVPLTLQYVPEEVIKTVQAVATVYYCRKRLTFDGCNEDAPS